MNEEYGRLRSLTGTLEAFLAREGEDEAAAIQEAVAMSDALRGDGGDRRAERLAGQVRRIAERSAELRAMLRDDLLPKIVREAGRLEGDRRDDRLVNLSTRLLDERPATLREACGLLVDELLDACRARSGFALFYQPESTEAEVLAARNFETKDFSLDEYRFSRTVLENVLSSGGTVLLDDASVHPAYSDRSSVRRFELRSVLAVPLRKDGHTIGAVYLENDALSAAFSDHDVALASRAASIAVSYFGHARLLPVTFDPKSRTFLDERKASAEIVGEHPSILELHRVVKKVAVSAATVLIEGETGTGKELVARAIHRNSGRKDGPFVTVNCAAIPESLMESELFGHEKGAFTGATGRYAGRLERGQGGTLFLDEVGELAACLQSKLLRFLQSGEVDRLGGRTPVRLDVRVVAATSRPLQELVREGRFQEALFYRLNVIPLRVPPLRERGGDVRLLTDHFVMRFAAAYGRRLRVDPAVHEALAAHAFPGNVRELENLIHRFVVLSTGEAILACDLPPEFRATRIATACAPGTAFPDGTPADLKDLHARRKAAEELLAEQARRLAERAVREAGGNVSVAASRLGVHRVTLHKMLRREAPKASRG